MSLTERLLIAAAIVGLWIAHTRRAGLNLGGAPVLTEEPAIASGSLSLSPVSSSQSTGVAATNPIPSFSNAFSFVVGFPSIKGPGNVPVIPPATQTGIDAHIYGAPASGYPTLAEPSPELARVYPFWPIKGEFVNPEPGSPIGLLWGTSEPSAYLGA